MTHYRKLISNLKNKTILDEHDVLRLSKFIPGDIFGTECVVYSNSSKRNDPKFSVKLNGKWNSIFLNKAVFQAFVKILKNDEFLRRICKTRRCLCLNHLQIRKWKTIIKQKPIKVFPILSLTISFD